MRAAKTDYRNSQKMVYQQRRIQRALQTEKHLRNPLKEQFVVQRTRMPSELGFFRRKDILSAIRENESEFEREIQAVIGRNMKKTITMSKIEEEEAKIQSSLKQITRQISRKLSITLKRTL